MTDERIETGALQIDDDWTGLFVRGDDALALMLILRKAYRSTGIFNNDELTRIAWLCATIDLDVDQQNIHTDREVQRIKTK